MKKFCSICGCEIDDYGHNPYPINDGRCCECCNDKVVEMRMLMYQLHSTIDDMVKAITPNNFGEMYYFRYKHTHYAFIIYKNKSKNLVVNVRTDKDNGWGMYSEADIFRMCIQNYLNDNHQDKNLGRIKAIDSHYADIQLHWFFTENLAETKQIA